MNSLFPVMFPGIGFVGEVTRKILMGARKSRVFHRIVSILSKERTNKMGIIIAGVVLGTILFIVFHGGNAPISGANNPSPVTKNTPTHGEEPTINMGWVAIFAAMIAIGIILALSAE